MALLLAVALQARAGENERHPVANSWPVVLASAARHTAEPPATLVFLVRSEEDATVLRRKTDEAVARFGGEMPPFEVLVVTSGGELKGRLQALTSQLRDGWSLVDLRDVELHP